LTSDPARLLRTVTFGTLDGGPWGVAWSSGSPLILLAATGAQPPSAIAGARLDGSEATEDWQLAGDGVQLALTGEGNEAEARLDDGGTAGFDQLCRVRGRASIGDSEVAIDCLGVRGARHEVDVRGVESIRGISAWWSDPDGGIALVAVRPRKGKGHARDAISATVFDADAATAVADPRLSTTYGADGTPARAGLELWLDGEEGKQYLRRAAGESLAVGTRVAEHDLELSAELFRWHSRGRDGAGVYLLARPA
jgi:hypothetical protein